MCKLIVFFVFAKSTEFLVVRLFKWFYVYSFCARQNEIKKKSITELLEEEGILEGISIKRDLVKEDHVLEI